MKQTIIKIVSRFKYWIAFIVFVVFIGFIGEHSLINRIRQKQEISELKSKIASERSRFEADSLEMIALKTDPEATRKIAREQYYMKNAGEDVFMINDETEEE